MSVVFELRPTYVMPLREVVCSPAHIYDDCTATEADKFDIISSFLISAPRSSLFRTYTEYPMIHNHKFSSLYLKLYNLKNLTSRSIKVVLGFDEMTRRFNKLCFHSARISQCDNESRLLSLIGTLINYPCE